jgi:hypothetical protein
MAGVVDTTYIFANNDLITSTRLNNIIDETTFTSDAIVSGNTSLEVVGGKLKVTAQGISSNELAANSVVTSKITDLNVTTGKLADSAVTTVKLNDGAVTTAKITDANVTTAKIADASITAPKLDGAQTGSAPIYGVRAWVNFDGTSGVATPIRASGNVASVVRDTTGRYTITLTTAMADTNYAIVGFARDENASGGNYFVSALSNSTKTTSAFQIEVNSPGATVDSPEINIMVIR